MNDPFIDPEYAKVLLLTYLLHNYSSTQTAVCCGAKARLCLQPCCWLTAF